MFWHVIVGLLRDGQARHGYELRRLFLQRSGTQVGLGNFYRELTRLTAAGFVRQVTNPPEVDGRRIPYEITERGESGFDDWLLAERRKEDDLHEWMLFVDRVPTDVRERILARRLEDLWIRQKLLARQREEAASSTVATFDPRLASVSREMKQTAAEIEFLEEFREQLAAWESRRDPGSPGATDGSAGRRETPAQSAPARGARRGTGRR
jgi:DNA-binding PadR family transcriptional regulator